MTQLIHKPATEPPNIAKRLVIGLFCTKCGQHKNSTIYRVNLGANLCTGCATGHPAPGEVPA